jgi:hypothetical protein
MFVIPEGNLLMFVIPEGNLLMFVIPEGNLRLPLLVLTGIWRLENSKLNRAGFYFAVPDLKQMTRSNALHQTKQRL